MPSNYSLSDKTQTTPQLKEITKLAQLATAGIFPIVMVGRILDIQSKVKSSKGVYSEELINEVASIVEESSQFEVCNICANTELILFSQGFHNNSFKQIHVICTRCKTSLGVSITMDD